MHDQVAMTRRLENLCDDNETLHGWYIPPGADTDDGTYCVTVRSWPHPDLDDGFMISIRYAYLTAGDGSDGWSKFGGAKGINMRTKTHPTEFIRRMAQLFTAIVNRREKGNSEVVEKDHRTE